MDILGVAELSVILTVVLALGVLGSAFLAIFFRPARPAAVRRAQRLAVARGSIAALSGLLVFALAVGVHILNPTWQGVTFVVGPLAASAVGLAVFAAMPTPTIDGEVTWRTAELTQRRVRHYSSRAQLVVFWVLVTVVSGVVVAAGMTSKAAPDGRSLCTSLYPVDCVAGGPHLYPGWFFAAPTLVLIVALVSAIALALHRIVEARGAAWAELTPRDTDLRRGSVRLVLQIGIAALVLTAGLFLGAAGIPLLNARVLDTGLTPDGNDLASVIGAVIVTLGGLSILIGLVVTVMTTMTTVSISRPEPLAAVQSSPS